MPKKRGSSEQRFSRFISKSWGRTRKKMRSAPITAAREVERYERKMFRVVVAKALDEIGLNPKVPQERELRDRIQRLGLMISEIKKEVYLDKLTVAQGQGKISEVNSAINTILKKRIGSRKTDGFFTAMEKYFSLEQQVVEMSKFEFLS